jgi:hypothetical protein
MKSEERIEKGAVVCRLKKLCRKGVSPSGYNGDGV